MKQHKKSNPTHTQTLPSPPHGKLITGNKQVDTPNDDAVIEDKPKKEMPKEAIPYQFKPGQSGNPSGRPKDPVKEIGKRIARSRVGKTLSEKDIKRAEDMGFNSKDITLLEYLMLRLATSANPQKIALFLERTYGKVPNININAEINAQLVMRFRSKFTDAELEAIGDGASPLEILLDKLPDVDEDGNAIPPLVTVMDADSMDIMDNDEHDDASVQ